MSKEHKHSLIMVVSLNLTKKSFQPRLYIKLSNCSRFKFQHPESIRG